MNCYALVVLKTSISSDLNDKTRLTTIVRKVEEAVHTVKGSEVIAENCFLIPLQNGLRALASVETITQPAHLEYTTLFLSERPTTAAPTP